MRFELKLLQELASSVNVLVHLSADMSTEGLKTILVTGASGLLGRAFMRKFRSQSDWKVIGLAHSRAGNSLVKVNLLDKEALKSTVLKTKPNVIIHSAAERNCNTVDNEYESAVNLNVNASKQIAEIAAEIGAILIYISTDYIFDGNNPPYTEKDTPNPLNKYGLTKLEGENVTLGSHDGSCVLRVPVLYGEVENLQESVVCGLLQNLIDVGKKCSISDYEIRYPTLVDDVAEACYRLVKYAMKHTPREFHGIYHYSGSEAMTKYGMITVISKVMKLPMDHVEKDGRPTQGAPRPYDSHLDTSKLDALVGKVNTSFEEGIKTCQLNRFVSK